MLLLNLVIWLRLRNQNNISEHELLMQLLGDIATLTALFYFTGPKDFNIKVRTIALRRGLKINEYGVFRGEEKLAGKTEEEIFDLLEMKYLDPKERENF